MAPIQLDALEARLGAFLGKVRAETGVPGIGVALSVAGRRAEAQVGTLAAGGPMPLTAGARFQLGCITKPLLAMTALELAGRGALDLDASIGEYLRELRATGHGRCVSVRHLLSHTSGYRGTDILDGATRALTWERFITYLRTSPRLFDAGSVFNYEHSEAVLLARILERVTGASWLQAVTAAVLEPLGVNGPVDVEDCASDVRVIDHRYDSRSGRFIVEQSAEPAEFWRPAFARCTLTLRDLLAVAERLASPSGTAGPAPLPHARSILRRMVALPPMAGGPLSELLPIAFGQGAAVLRGGYFGNTGVARGQCIGLRFEPDRRVAVVVGLNAFVPHLRDLILTAVCTSVTGSASAEDARPLELRLEELHGFYRGGGSRVVWAEHRHDRLICAIGIEGSPHTLHAELVADDERRWRLSSPAPQLSIGALRAPGSGEPVLMVGLNAFKRVAESAPSNPRPRDARR